MRKFSKNLIAASVLGAAAFGSTAAMAEFSGNIGVASNYIWRGVTQTNDEAAISGGLDYAHDSGFYAGTWVSNVSPLDNETGQYEMDFYLGYGSEVGGMSYDVGAIYYMYPVDDTDGVEADFTEIYGSLGFGPVTASLAYTVNTEADIADDNDLYASLGADFEIKEGLSLGLLVGNYDYDDPGSEDYTHFNASLSKDDFTFAVDKHDKEADDDVRFSVAWAKSFDL